MPFSAAVGAVVTGVDLREPLPDKEIVALRRALGEYGVVFFRDQDLTPEQYISFAEQQGDINVNRFFASVPGHPKIAEVLKEPDHKRNIGGGWHTDHTYDHIPAMASILYAREVPSRGGDTLFSNMYLAYETLSEGMKEMLSGMRAVHSSRHTFGRAAKRYRTGDDELEGRIGNPDDATQDAVHPVVVTHPISGRKSLYVNSGFTTHFDGWTQEESAPLLRYLYQHGAKSEFTGRFRWEKGSIAFWDNRATWHYALNDYHGQRRYMHRITLEGEALH